MRHFSKIALLLFTLIPGIAFAHAIPVSEEPPVSAVVETAPRVIIIHFSERIDAGASSINVENGGRVISGGAHAVAGDPRSLQAALAGETGIYNVTWSVVSADDGHFTKGAYSFVVGKGASAPPSEAMSEVVQIATLPEALAMTVELLGNGILWAAILLFAIVMRPLCAAFTGERRIIEKGYAAFIALGSSLVVCGGVLQILLKSSDLAVLRGATLASAIPLYLSTEAGRATLLRSAAVLVLVAVFCATRRAMFASSKTTLYEYALMLCLVIFAYFRAIISHAAANPFYPHLSITVNFFHVIEKDAWAGTALIALAMLCVPRLSHMFSQALPRITRLLAFNVAAVGLTGSYIVWLHLKSFQNLVSTQWGNVFLPLLFPALLLVGMRAYHVFMPHARGRAFARLLPMTLAAEFALTLLVVYFSSVVIITSPPLSSGSVTVRSHTDAGVHIALEKDRTRDDSALLVVSHGSPKEPRLIITKGSEQQGVRLSKRFEGGYSFPKALLDGGASLAVTVPQERAYDAHAAFTASEGDFEPDDLGTRPFDAFTMVMLSIAALSCVFAYALWRFSSIAFSPGRFTAKPYRACAAFLVVVISVAAGAGALARSPYANPFRAQCERDGNLWHSMVPSVAGQSTAATPQEGCMWGMGAYTYQFPDRREYEYLQSLPHADVSLALSPQKPVAGSPATLTVALKEPDGSPAQLFVDMEKLIHVVIISKDETVFAHIHPDDAHPIPQRDVDNSTFTLEYAFPKSGAYLISVDYAHGITLESKQFIVEVGGAPAQDAHAAAYPHKGNFGGYDVELKYSALLAGEPATIQYVFSKDGKPVTNIESYLSAPMHISIVQNDLSAFMHVHGEVHPPGTPLSPIVVRDGKIIHPMASMMYPPPYGPTIEAHVLFPRSGLYTIWGQFKAGGRVIPTAFTVRVE